MEESDGKETDDVVEPLNGSSRPGEPSMKTLSISVPTKPDLFGAYTAIALQLIVIAVLVTLPFEGIYLKKPGSLSTAEHSLYVTGSTVLVTIITTYSTGQIRKLWALDTTNLISVVEDPNGAPNHVDRRARTTLGIASFYEQIHSWPIALTFLVSGLMTTAIVSGITPTGTIVQLKSSSQFAVALFPPESDGFDDVAGYDIESSYCFHSSSEAFGSFSWPLADGSYLSLDTSWDPNCPTQIIKQVLSGNQEIPPGYVYAFDGTAMQSSAIGTPINIISGILNSFGQIDESYLIGKDPLFRWATHCVPVVARNPVQCQAIGSVSASTHSVTVSSGVCNITNPIYAVDPTVDGASAAGGCTAGQDNGKATILIGSVNDHAAILASAMTLQSFVTQPLPQTKNYSVICNIDIAPAIGFQTVTLSIVSDELRNDLGYSYSLAGTGESCTPISGTEPVNISAVLTDYTLAMGASGLQAMLSENTYVDGWWGTLYQTVSRVDTYEYSFNNSKNRLEDAMGVAVGLSLGFFWGHDAFISSQISVENGVLAVLGVRVGSGEPWAVVYILPELCVAAVIVVLLMRQWASGRGSADTGA